MAADKKRNNRPTKIKDLKSRKLDADKAKHVKGGVVSRQVMLKK